MGPELDVLRPKVLLAFGDEGEAALDRLGDLELDRRAHGFSRGTLTRDMRFVALRDESGPRYSQKARYGGLFRS